MTNIKCFFVEPTDRAAITLRRFKFSEGAPCQTSGYGYHNAATPIGEKPLTLNERGYYNAERDDVPHDDSRWPVACACGYVFLPSDEWQVNQTQIYTRQDTGEDLKTAPHRFPVGAMWYSDWLLPRCAGPDGHSLSVMTPGGEWNIDSRASNCTKPDDDQHKCWVRHGAPPLITVDKNGLTCAAGAGSIMAGSYHGFLQNGFLTGC